MTEEKKKTDVVDEKDAEEKEQTISPSYANSPLASAHTIDIDTRVSNPSEEDMVALKEWGDKNQQ